MIVVDQSCKCIGCTERTNEFYKLPATCFNCGDSVVAKIRKGDSPGSMTCPTCGKDRDWLYGKAKEVRL